jgi:hypothetical protein
MKAAAFRTPPVASWLAPNGDDLPPSLHEHYTENPPQLQPKPQSWVARYRDRPGQGRTATRGLVRQFNSEQRRHA